MKHQENIVSIVVIAICVVIAIVVGYFFYHGYHDNQNWERIHNNGDKMKVKPKGSDSYVTLKYVHPNLYQRHNKA